MPKDVIRFLEKNDFVQDRINGSHHIYLKEGIHLTVPVHSRDIKIGTLLSIIKNSGIKKSEWKKGKKTSKK